MTGILRFALLCGWVVPASLALYVVSRYLAHVEQRLLDSAAPLHSFPYRSALMWSAGIATAWLFAAMLYVALAMASQR